MGFGLHRGTTYLQRARQSPRARRAPTSSGYRRLKLCDALAFVLSLNLKRRQLSASELAFVALEIEKYEAGEAKKRQATSTGGGNPQLVALMPEAETGKARDKAAQAVGVSPRYVQDAKKIESAAPELAAQVRAGQKTLTQAVREVKEHSRASAQRIKRQSCRLSPTRASPSPKYREQIYRLPIYRVAIPFLSRFMLASVHARFPIPNSATFRPPPSPRARQAP